MVVLCLPLETLARVAQSLRFDYLHRQERGSHKPLRGSRLRPQQAGPWSSSCSTRGCLWLPMQPALWPTGVLHRLRQLTGVSRWSAVTKVQFKSLVILVRLLRVQLANFTPSFEFQLEARVAIALFCSFMQVDSRTMGRSNWITPGSVAPVLMDLENRCLKAPTKHEWVACHLRMIGARMLYMLTD